MCPSALIWLIYIICQNPNIAILADRAMLHMDESDKTQIPFILILNLEKPDEPTRKNSQTPPIDEKTSN